jgi:hypothetical protein
MHIKLWKIQMSSLLKGKQLQQQHQTFDQKKIHQLFLIVAPSNIHVEPRKRKASKPIEKARHIHFQTFSVIEAFHLKSKSPQINDIILHQIQLSNCLVLNVDRTLTNLGITPASTMMLWLEWVNVKFANTPPAASFTLMSSSFRDLISKGRTSGLAIFTLSFSSTDKFQRMHILCSIT